MKFPSLMVFCAALLFARCVQAEDTSQSPQAVPMTFIGVLDFEARYGGSLEWAQAAWGMEDPELEFEVSDGRPFEASSVRLKAKQFAMLETGYESSSIPVYNRLEEPRVNDWVQVMIDGDLKWIRLHPEDGYTSYPALFDQGRLAYLTRKTLNIAAAPGGVTTTRVLKPAEQGVDREGPWDAHVEVIGRAEIVNFDGRIPNRENWLKVRVGSEQPCEGAASPAEPLAEGWIRAHHLDDRSVAVWFFSRGC